MKHVGGRMTVFAEMLDEATETANRMEKGKAPAIGPMERTDQTKD
jgi:hypothetical protein